MDIPKLVPLPGFEDADPRGIRYTIYKSDAHRQRLRRKTMPVWMKRQRLGRLLKWQEENPDKVKAKWRRKSKTARWKRRKNLRKTRREHLKRQLPADLTLEDWGLILAGFNDSCAYCGKHKSQMDYPIHKEHVVPLSAGGGLTVSNIVPACRSCNSRKGEMDLREWLQDECLYEATLMSMGDAEWLVNVV